MSQGLPPDSERRHEPRRPAAFAFWFGPIHRRTRRSAWMVDLANCGACFLTAADAAPALGQRLALSEMFSQDRLVREDASMLPSFARVVRVERPDGVTRRVAVRFEADARAGLQPCRSSRCAAARSARRTPLRPPPAPASAMYAVPL